VTEQLVRYADKFTVTVIGPSVIRTDQRAFMDLPQRELYMTVQAPVFDGVHLVLLIAKQRDRLSPETSLANTTPLESLVVFDSVPIVRV